MADKYQPIAPQANANPFIAPGVTDNSSSMLLSGLGKIGVEAYTGYTTAGLQKDIQGEAEAFFKNKAVADSVPALGEKLGGLVEGEKEFLLSGIPAPEEQEQYTRGLATKLSAYQNAVSQGRMSISELQTRILSKTREAVNQNPFLQRELLATADKYMELSGLGSWMKQQEQLGVDQTKAQQKMMDDLDAEGREKDIPGWFRMGMQQKMEAIDIVRKREFVVKQAETITKSGQFVDQQQIKEWRDNGTFDQYFNGRLDQLNVGVQSIFKENNTDSYPQVKNAIDNYTLAHRQEFLKGIPPSYRETKEGRDFIADYDKQVESMKKAMEDLGSGANASKAWGNLSSARQSMQDVELRSKLNPGHFDMLAKLKMADPSGTILGDGNLKKIDSFLSATFNNLFGTPSFTASLPTAQAPNKTSANVLSLAGTVGTKEKDWAPFNTIVSSYNKGVKDINDPKSRSAFMYQNLQAISKMDMTGLGAEGVAGVHNMVKTYFDDPQFGLKAMFANAKNYNIQMDILDDGRLLFTGKDAEAFNGAFGSRVNTALEAYAKANGQSVKEASGGFYQEHFGKYGEAVDAGLAEKPWKAYTPADAFDLFEKGTIDEAEYMQLIKMMKDKPVGVTTSPNPSIPAVTSTQPEVPPGMNKGASGPITTSPTPLPKASPVEPVKAPQRVSKEAPGTQFADRPAPIVKKGKAPEPKPTVTRAQMKQAEKEVVGAGLTEAPLKHMSNQEAIMKRAEALAKGETKAFVSTDRDRILASPKGKWVVYSQGEGRIRMYSPVEKVYVDVPLKDVPQLEKWFKLPVDQWKKWEK